MPLVDGDGRSKLACARSQPMGYRTPLAQVGAGGDLGPQAHIQRMGRAMPQVIMGQARMQLRWRDHTQLLKCMNMVHDKTALENR